MADTTMSAFFTWLAMRFIDNENWGIPYDAFDVPGPAMTLSNSRVAVS